MNITLEQVEKLREKADVSYEEAKALLEQYNGDLLEALIALERRGKADTASQGGFYTTRPTPEAAAEESDAPPPHKARKSGVLTIPAARGKKDGDRHGEVWRAFCDLLHRAVANHLEVWKGERMLAYVPVAVLVALLVFFFWITLPLLVVGLFFGCRYRFGGPDLDRESVNHVMENVTSTVEDVKSRVKSEFNKNM